jgi:CheY-like chemotaxis protein
MNAEAAAKRTIFIVEDQPILCAWIRMVLENTGYAVIEANSGVAALDLWKENKTHVDLLLTDMVMPDGISGQQLADKLKADNPALKVVFTSGYRTEVVGQGLPLREGVNFLEKPYSPQSLIQIVGNALNSVAPETE